ncbi:uncharacterized protein LOC109817941 [Cajanus cajan]|uniref:uncharacterized protein LOC109817941 n=1 Tax=Cajanus cajan TaxID=3821 RepID=UPI00098D8446|nr:uncharacterized protein LOC109817941 [Cajanus cajan]
MGDHQSEEHQSGADNAETIEETNVTEMMRQLKEEMAAMKQQRERDAAEMAALRAENANLRSQYRDPTWKPSETTRSQGSFHLHGQHTSAPNTSAAAHGIHASAARPIQSMSTGAHRHPFTTSIMQSSLLDNWKSLPLDKYDDTTDPDEHVDVFLTQVTLSTTDDAALCRIFPTSLKGRALSWFTRRTASSIDSFSTLASQFTVQFATSRPHQLTSLALVNIRQERKESLRAFMTRFNKAALEIRDLHPAVALHHLTTALKPGPFANSICKKPPTDMDDLRRIADKYMQMEELAEFRNQARTEVAAKPKRPIEGNTQSRPKELEPQERSRNGPRYPQYTPLNSSRATILEQALASKVLIVPKQASTPPRADTSKTCKYHRNRGHSTEECAALKDRIEDLIKQGQLQGFVERPNTSRRTDRSRRPDHPEPRAETRVYRERSRPRERRDPEPTSQPRRVINRIAGGFAGGGSSSSAQRRHLRAIRHVNAVETARHSQPTISFTSADFKGIDPNQDDPMVISVEIHNCIVRKTLVDQGSSADILYWSTFKQLGIPESELIPYDEPLVGFSGERVKTKGYIKLSTRFGFKGAEYRDIPVKYVVVNANTSYNILLSRPSLNRLGAIVSTPHLAMKFPSGSGRVITVHADQKTARECYFASLRLPKPRAEIVEEPKRIHSVSSERALDLDPRMDQDERVEPIEEKQPLQVGTSDAQLTYLGIVLSEREKAAIEQVVLDNRDLFAWHPSDMPGINPNFLCHKLSISREARSIAQRRRKTEEEKKAAIEAEVARLLEAQFIREVHYTTWLDNVVIVRKPNGKWRMCTDYTNLNKACPKDAYPLPNIDRLVDGASGHRFLSFLDAYSGYNQIRMHPQDEEKMAFITETANYCYRVMPFGLKNAEATYQRLMNKIFHDQIGRCLEVYVDDMVVKSGKVSAHVHHLAEVFRALRQHWMRLNPEKCVFGVSGVKFLGFMLSSRVIEANPDKCQAILEMKSPDTLKEV